jgi:hypothetical protein
MPNPKIERARMICKSRLSAAEARVFAVLRLIAVIVYM